jgi:3-oxocholest-4-en-26-oyl-CoA dehydrogenase beta subunit
MNYDLDVEKTMLKESARNFFTKEVNSALIRELEQDENGYSKKIWKKMAQVGWMELTIPEKYGGFGGTFHDLCVVLEEMGYDAFDSPFFATAVLGTSALLNSGSEKQKSDFFPKIAQGDQIFTLAYMGADEPECASDIPVRAVIVDEGFVVDGTYLFVPYAHIADIIICAVRTGEPGEAGNRGVSLFAIARNTPGLSVTLLQTIANDKQCEVIFDKVILSKENLLGELNQGWSTLETVLRKAAVAKCAEMVGHARKALKMTVDYAKKREQFGRPIGSFQAVQHHCANMLTYLDTSALITHETCRLISRGLPCVKEAAMCKAWVSEANRKLIALGHQVMGGFGFIEEVDLQIYFRRSKAAEQQFGDGTFHREVVARQIDL